jgi:hypothetical protein
MGKMIPASQSQHRPNDSNITKHKARHGQNDFHIAIAATVTHDADIAKSTTAKTIRASQLPAWAK